MTSEMEMVLDELMVLRSMFGDELKQLNSGSDELSATYELDITLNKGDYNNSSSSNNISSNANNSNVTEPLTFTLRLSFSPEKSLARGYPKSGLPFYTVHASWLKAEDKDRLHQQLDELYQSTQDVILFQWIEWIRESAYEFFNLQEIEKKHEELQRHAQEHQQRLAEQQAELARKREEQEQQQYLELMNERKEFAHVKIISGEPFTDRKSKFVAHCAVVHSVREVDYVLRQLKSDKKIAMATHNMVAYRIEQNGGRSMIEFRDDDGETGAGDKMLYLLQVADVRNCVVVVTRWFGGILLGADRFKIITNVAKELLQQQGILATKNNNNNNANATTHIDHHKKK